MTERNSKILLVDVPVRIRKLFESQRTAYSIVAAENVSDALRLVEEENIKLCVLSDNLPDMDLFIREVRSTPLASELPLLVITSTRTHEELFKLGADAFFGASESDARFMEKIELLLGLGDSNRSNVFAKRSEAENPFHFVVQYGSQMVADMETVTPVEHARLIPDDQSLQSLIQLVEQDVSGSERTEIDREFTEGLEAVEPQGYIGQQLSVGERMELNEHESESGDQRFEASTPASVEMIVLPSSPDENSSDFDNVSLPTIASVPEPAGRADSESENTNVRPESIKHHVTMGKLPLLYEGNTLSQPFSIAEPPNQRLEKHALLANVRSARQQVLHGERVHVSPAIDVVKESHRQSSSPVLPTSKPVFPASELSPSRASVAPALFASPSRQDRTRTATDRASDVTDDGGPIPLSGEFIENPFWWIFRAIHEKEVSGTLSVTWDEIVRQFHFDKGALMVVSSNARNDRLVELLYKEGRISEQQYESASMTVAASGRRAGVVMIDKGIISSRELFPLVRYHYETMVYDTLSRSTGAWQMIPGRYQLNERIVLDASVPKLILDAFRNQMPDDLVFSIVQDVAPLKLEDVSAEYVSSLNLNRMEQEILEWSDGTRSVAWLAHRLGMSTTELRSIVAGLMVVRVLHPANTNGHSFMPPAGTSLTEDQTRTRVGESSLPLDDDWVADARLLEEKLAQISEGTYFDIAEVAEDASIQEIRQSIQRLKSMYCQSRFSMLEITDLREKLAVIETVLEEAEDVLLSDDFRDGYRKAIQEMSSVE